LPEKAYLFADCLENDGGVHRSRDAVFRCPEQKGSPPGASSVRCPPCKISDYVNPVKMSIDLAHLNLGRCTSGRRTIIFPAARYPDNAISSQKALYSYHENCYKPKHQSVPLNKKSGQACRNFSSNRFSLSFPTAPPLDGSSLPDPGWVKKLA